MSKHKRGVCPECKVKEGDPSRKILYQCKFCERWFCAKHFEPRLVYIPDYDAFVKYPEVRVTFEKEWRREDGHPDFAYSLERFKELDMEEKLYSKLIEGALNRSKAYRKTPRMDICPKCGSTKQFIEEQAFNKKTVSMKCKICGFKWTQPRFREGELKSIPEESLYPSAKPQEPTEVSAVSTPPYIQPKKEVKSRRKVVILGIAVLLFVIVIASLIFVLPNMLAFNKTQWQTPSTQELKTWLEQDNTNELTPDDISNRTFFAETLASRARAKNWKMGVVYVRGYEVNFNIAFDHVFNAIRTKEGLVYITPEFDEVWWNINHESIEIGGTYSFGISGFFYGYVEEVRTLLDY